MNKPHPISVPVRPPAGDAGNAEQWDETLSPAAAAAPEVALLLVSGRQPPSLAQHNNNSFCHAIQSSPRLAHLCDPYCGIAFYKTLEAGDRTKYRCHAGFQCFTVKLPRDGENANRQLVVIGGRALTSVDDYAALKDRTARGDLRDLASSNLFANVHFTTEQELNAASRRVESAFGLNVEDRSRVVVVTKDAEEMRETNAPNEANDFDRVAPEEIENTPSSSSLVLSELLSAATSLKEACEVLLREISVAHGVGNALLALHQDGAYVKLAATGSLIPGTIRFKLDSRDPVLLRAAREGEWLRLRDFASNITIEPERHISTTAKIDISNSLLLPLVAGAEVQGVFVVADPEFGSAERSLIAQFCHDITEPLELLRLREELTRRKSVAKHLQRFIQNLRAVTAEEAYKTILNQSTELIGAERASLLLYDEAAEELSLKAATGPHADEVRSMRVRLGDGVSGGVLQSGQPLIVTDFAAQDEYKPTAREHPYKTSSFISYPIIIGGRRVGVINVTDKRGGGVYDERDLGLLRMITPELVLALDCAEWQQKATRFQILSITDPLTDLLNRRYLEERLAEETERSKRSRYQMSFMMIDIDDFKHYNDRNGHQAGDLALEMTARSLKSALRSADVAARYGGEEFCVLLPQTNLEEARIIAERVRHRVERTRYPNGSEQPLGAVTVSIGISTFTPDTDSPASIINAADQALYTAKRLGKNRVEPQG